MKIKESGFKERLEPQNCLIRMCRFCISPMQLIEFETDKDSRWYLFCCDNCEHHTRLSEPIFDEMMIKEYDMEHEPLTFSEQKIQRMATERENHNHFSSDFQKEHR